ALALEHARQGGEMRASAAADEHAGHTEPPGSFAVGKRVVANGKTHLWTGQDAPQDGLIDQLGRLADRAVAKLGKTRPPRPEQGTGLDDGVTISAGMRRVHVGYYKPRAILDLANDPIEARIRESGVAREQHEFRGTLIRNEALRQGIVADGV